MESAIEAMGLYERPERPTAFAFLDLTGYTRLTDDPGDEAAGEGEPLRREYYSQWM
jgi:hypothetical protein